MAGPVPSPHQKRRSTATHEPSHPRPQKRTWFSFSKSPTPMKTSSLRRSPASPSKSAKMSSARLDCIVSCGQCHDGLGVWV